MSNFENPTKNIALEIANDKLSAYLTIKKTGSIINEQEIALLIASAGIKAGILEAKQFLQQTGLTKDYNKPFPIALGEKGTEPQAEFSALFDVDNCFSAKKFSSDFTILNNLSQVEKDFSLAHLFITRPGRNGFDVFGEAVLPKLSEEELLLSYLGENVYYSKDRSQIYAKTKGYPYLDENKKVSIKNNFIIDSDIKPNSKKLKINGDLIINGHVKQGNILHVLGNLEIKGNIEDSKIYAEGDIKINGKVVNCREDGINSKKNIYLESAQNSLILSGESIFLKDKAKFCRFIADDKIEGDDSNSAFEGGHCQACNSINFAFLGNSSGIETEAELTVSPYKKENILILGKKLKHDKNLDENLKNIFEQRIENLSKKLEKDLTYNLLQANNDNKFIGACKYLYNGVYLRILKNSINIKDDTKNAKYYYSNKQLILKKQGV